MEDALSMTKDLEAILFDLDGTLLTIEKRFYNVFNDVLEGFGRRKIARRNFLRSFHNNQLYYLPFGPAQTKRLETRRFWDTFLRRYGRKPYTEYSAPIRGAREVIKRIRKCDIRVAVVTGRICSPFSVRQELKEIGIDKCVDAIVTKAMILRPGNSYHATSREAEIRKALRRLEACARRSAFVADYVEDIRSAKPLGVTTIVVLSGSSSLHLLRKESPDHIIESVRDLPALLKREFGQG